MALIRDPDTVGFVRRFCRVYREKRKDQHPKSPLPFRMPRWAAAQIAWHQACNAKGLN